MQNRPCLVWAYSKLSVSYGKKKKERERERKKKDCTISIVAATTKFQMGPFFKISLAPDQPLPFRYKIPCKRK